MPVAAPAPLAPVAAAPVPQAQTTTVTTTTAATPAATAAASISLSVLANTQSWKFNYLTDTEVSLNFLGTFELEISFTAESDYKSITNKTFTILPGARKQSDQVCKLRKTTRNATDNDNNTNSLLLYLLFVFSYLWAW